MTGFFLILAAAILLLTGCASTPKPVTQTKTAARTASQPVSKSKCIRVFSGNKSYTPEEYDRATGR